jgi:hypothetical protein
MYVFNNAKIVGLLKWTLPKDKLIIFWVNLDDNWTRDKQIFVLFCVDRENCIHN